MADEPDRIFVVVHGVGRQLELATLRAMLEGAHLVSGSGARFTPTQLVDRRDDGGGLVVDPAGRFAEVRYAQVIRTHEEYSERDLRHWMRTFRHQLEEMHRRRRGEPVPDFSSVEHVVEDILLTTRVARFLAERLKLGTMAVESSAAEFLQQIQLFTDRRAYREAVIASVLEQLAELNRRFPTSRLVLAAHSLGTVVTFMCLLRAQHAGNAPWLDRVEWFVTFGSPIDLFLVLYDGEYFPAVPPSRRAPGRSRGRTTR